ncbi:aminotransferase class III-fold pyridoxal phosphate-dependent enzyme [Burkholderia multivorans]|uniref:aspartate aminotransferase family protein n=1 Tax=Burkholderia multivorans TaxID=87883 RepID=UPI000D007F32|nr:aminotransferase class III-fold pyridoxal phosphate-dependent enzyme [Burkholderia multivorans]MBU9331372.1 aminotransferase class III-fold pyridoxal phosphate-dependent enzyme [Burkholderia multivorans]MBU9462373.1 aminotransferase class III-fold pyridoxal phosphate-dependent enzyme [Burkholderia multivorans]MBU9526681.1 aminotransferase class III-fold pyridoxal phosphate-dependent enzyme [Burkholderia multivorans]MBU9534228.1 aminotransferase class III-fold pyridoxal phosphate-dependent en
MRSDPAMLNAFDPQRASALDAQARALVERRARVLGPAYRLFYETPLHIVRGEGVWLYDSAGRAYLDAYNNVASIGHCRPEVVEAIAKQASTLNTHTRYLHDGILDYAERLLRTMPDALSQAMFTCTGSEANDLALRIAKQYTGGTGVIVTQLAYHGVTAAIAEISPSLGRHVPLGLHVRTVAPPDTYRDGDADVGARFARDVQRAIDDLVRHGVRPAALIVDTLFTSDGVFADPRGFLQGAVAAIRQAGGVFIADEVQAGFARTGSKMWGFERHDVVPDLVTMGKPMGNGHPIAGLAARAEVLERFGKDTRYFNTFGGNPVSCAAAAATLDVIVNDGLQANASRIGAYLREGFRTLARKHDLIGDVRGDGLFLGVELVRDRHAKTPAEDETQRVVNLMRERGVLISATGVRGNVLKIRPLLPFTQEHADLLLAAADGSLAAL